MEIGTALHIRKWVRMLLLVALFMAPESLLAQPAHKSYTIRDGKMCIEISRAIRDSELDSFIAQFDLFDVPIKLLLKSNQGDSLRNQGWNVNVNNDKGIMITKALGASEDIFNPIHKVNITAEQQGGFKALFPAVNNGVVLGYNQFKNKSSFLVRDSFVRFLLKGHMDAGHVSLAGSFNNWSPEALAMRRTDSGWIGDVKLSPGKYWYKFVVDGHWIFDTDNYLRENDGLGNINSVYFKANALFVLEGFDKAKNVFLAGSFNDWKPKALPMQKVGTEWQLPVYLAEGTHTYKFVVDGRWYADPDREGVNDGAGGQNSVLRIGKPHIFRLSGFTNAKKVMLVGSFNKWRDFEWEMTKTAEGWEIPYVLGPGNYEYKFVVDRKWIADPSNVLSGASDGNSFLIVQPNYTFRLKGFPDATTVYLAGDFNNWDPRQLAMKKVGDEWTFPVHVAAGKVRYKFVVDNKWILDPGNKLWEQNEHNTGNSIIWIE